MMLVGLHFLPPHSLSPMQSSRAVLLLHGAAEHENVMSGLADAMVIFAGQVCVSMSGT